MANRSGAYGGGNPYPTNSSPCGCCGLSPCVCAVNGCTTTLSEYKVYARPQDYGTTPEMMRLILSKGVQDAGAPVVFPNPDPDHDGDPLDGGKPGYLDWGAGASPTNHGSMYDPRQDT